jgi:hypothetical protein
VVTPTLTGAEKAAHDSEVIGRYYAQVTEAWMRFDLQTTKDSAVHHTDFDYITKRYADFMDAVLPKEAANKKFPRGVPLSDAFWDAGKTVNNTSYDCATAEGDYQHAVRIGDSDSGEMLHRFKTEYSRFSEAVFALRKVLWDLPWRDYKAFLAQLSEPVKAYVFAPISGVIIPDPDFRTIAMVAYGSGDGAGAAYKRGDVIVSLDVDDKDKTNVDGWESVIDYMNAHAGEKVTVHVRRAGQEAAFYCVAKSRQ